MRDYVWIEDEPVGTVDSGPQPTQFAWVHTDRLGTPLAVTSSPATGSAATIWRASYEPFGLATVNEDPDGDTQLYAMHLRFPGQRWDGESGGHYNFFRVYDQRSGSFFEHDPIGLVAGTNAFSYVRGDPTNATDPSGLFSLEDSVVGRLVADIPIDGGFARCLADCIEAGDLGLASLVPPAFSRLPKEMLPPFRSIPTGAPGAGGTTILSSGAHSLGQRGLISGSTRRAIRNAGRAASRVATPLTLAEGVYSWGLIGYCAAKCSDPACDASRSATHD